MSKGNHLSFEVFKVGFEQLPDWQDLLLECAEFLIRPDIKKIRTWKDFAASFFDAYLKTLCARWGYKPESTTISRIEVTDPPCFMAVMSILYHSGIIKSTTRKLARNIYRSADTGYTLTTLQRIVSDGWLDYDGILAIINECKNKISGK